MEPLVALSIALAVLFALFLTFSVTWKVERRREHQRRILSNTQNAARIRMKEKRKALEEVTQKLKEEEALLVGSIDLSKQIVSFENPIVHAPWRQLPHFESNTCATVQGADTPEVIMNMVSIGAFVWLRRGGKIHICLQPDASERCRTFMRALRRESKQLLEISFDASEADGADVDRNRRYFERLHCDWRPVHEDLQHKLLVDLSPSDSHVKSQVQALGDFKPTKAVEPSCDDWTLMKEILASEMVMCSEGTRTASLSTALDHPTIVLRAFETGKKPKRGSRVVEIASRMFDASDALKSQNMSEFR